MPPKLELRERTEEESSRSSANTQTEKQETPSWLLKLPNQLTLFRMACIPAVVLLLIRGATVVEDQPFQIQTSDVIAALVFGLAAGTDFLDGWLARRFGAQSMLGKLLDPLADKLLVVSSMIILVEKQRLAGWVAVVLIVRDLGINAIRLSAYEDRIVIESSQLGKWKTVFLCFGMAGLMVHGTLWSVPWLLIGQVATGIAVAASLWSALTYLVEYARALKERKDSASEDSLHNQQ